MPGVLYFLRRLGQIADLAAPIGHNGRPSPRLCFWNTSAGRYWNQWTTPPRHKTSAPLFPYPSISAEVGSLRGGTRYRVRVSCHQPNRPLTPNFPRYPALWLACLGAADCSNAPSLPIRVVSPQHERFDHCIRARTGVACLPVCYVAMWKAPALRAACFARRERENNTHPAIPSFARNYDAAETPRRPGASRSVTALSSRSSSSPPLSWMALPAVSTRMGRLAGFRRPKGLHLHAGYGRWTRHPQAAGCQQQLARGVLGRYGAAACVPQPSHMYLANPPEPRERVTPPVLATSRSIIGRARPAEARDVR